MAMARKYLAFDIETAKVVPGVDFNWKPHRPLGISCIAAIATDTAEPRVWLSRTADGTPAPQMARAMALDNLDIEVRASDTPGAHEPITAVHPLCGLRGESPRPLAANRRRFTSADWLRDL